MIKKLSKDEKKKLLIPYKKFFKKYIDNDWELLKYEYTKLCNKFSKGYLLGSYWYIGEDIDKYLREEPYFGIFNKKILLIIDILERERNI